jgi:hypothetical protein
MRKALSSFAAASVMLVSANASAAFHLTKIVEVFAGNAAHPNESYVLLQAYSAGQNFVAGHTLKVYDNAGAEIVASKVTLATNVANGSDQAYILIGTSGVQAAFGVAPDYTLPAKLTQAGGAVCFDALDCFSWGNYVPASAPDTSVTPFAALTANKAARRSIAAGNPALLELADDSNNNAADFAAVDPAPKNNNTGVTPPAPMDAGVDSSTNPPAGKDSGVGTMPSPNNPTVTPDSGAGAAADDGSGGDDGGCSFTARSSDGWSTVLGLLAAASIFVMSRRRRVER